jgi:hypothetical protein
MRTEKPQVTAEMLLLLVGGWVGFWIGVHWAEITRARFDMRKVWHGRRNYRGR